MSKMMELPLVELKSIKEDNHATQGKMFFNNKLIACTLEKPWRDNKRYISCIPAGLYKCVKHSGIKFKNVWILLDVPDRDTILIHNGNFITDTDGCILVGQNFGLFKGLPMITNSVPTLNQLRSFLPDQFNLKITRT